MPTSRRCIANALVLDPLDGVTPCDVIVEGERIADLVPPMAGSSDAERIDGTGRLIVPGFVNLHCHSHFTLARGLLPSASLELHLHAAPGLLGGRTHEDRHLCSLVTAVELLRRGCTTCFDMVAEPPQPTLDGLQSIADAYMAAGLRLVLTPAVGDGFFWSSIPGLVERLPAALRTQLTSLPPNDPDVVAALIDRFQQSPAYPADRVRAALSATIPILCSDDFLARLGRHARDRALPFHTHLVESKLQAILAGRRYGTSMTRHLDRLGIIDSRFTGAHTIWISDDDAKLLADRGANVSHNPVANLHLGSGVAAVTRLRRQGINIGLGTDGCTTASQVSMLEALKLAVLSSRIHGPSPQDWLEPQHALEAATVGGARALGWENDIGRIRPGYKADLVFIDLSDTAYRPLNDVVSQFVLGEVGTGICDVMVNGRFVMRDRRILTVDEEKLTRAAQDAADRLRERNKATRESHRVASAAVDATVCAVLREPFDVARAFF